MPVSPLEREALGAVVAGDMEKARQSLFGPYGVDDLAFLHAAVDSAHKAFGRSLPAEVTPASVALDDLSKIVALSLDDRLDHWKGGMTPEQRAGVHQVLGQFLSVIETVSVQTARREADATV